MSSPTEKKGKGKVPTRDYPQNKRLPAMGQSFEKHEGASSTSHRGAASLQPMYPEMVTYSSGFMAITLERVRKRIYQFKGGIYTELPHSTKFILDNLQRAFIQKHQSLFQKTLTALELHLVELEKGNIALTSQLSGKEDIHSMDKTTIMSTDYARLSLKTQNQLRSAVANLPPDIQSRIFRSKAMTESYDQWFRHFKIMVTSHFPVQGEEVDPSVTAFFCKTWNQHFMGSHRVYEKHHPFLGLIVNYEDGVGDEDRNPSWLSKMFEYGFLKLIKLTDHIQISQFLQIIQQVVRKIKSPFVTIRCWSTLPQWDVNNWMTVQPSHHLVLIDGYTHNGPWYDGDSYLAYTDPLALVQCWSAYFNNEIRDVTGELWEKYYFVGNTGRITVFITKPYSEAFNTQRIGFTSFPEYTTEKLDYEPLMYCGFCNLFDRYHEHGDDDPFDGYPSGYDTD